MYLKNTNFIEITWHGEKTVSQYLMPTLGKLSYKRCNFSTKTTTPENSSRRILWSFVQSQDLKSRFVTICDKSVGVTNYFSSLLTHGFAAISKAVQS